MNKKESQNQKIMPKKEMQEQSVKFKSVRYKFPFSISSPTNRDESLKIPLIYLITMISSIMQIPSLFQFYRIVMQSSQKSKSRKPIFGSKQNNKDCKLDKLCQTTSSYLKESVTFTKTHPHLFESGMVQSNWQIPLNRSSSVAKITIPMNVRTYSPPRIVQQQNTNVVVNKTLAAQVQAIPIYRQAPVIQQQIQAPIIQKPIISTPFYQTQPQFYKSQGPSKVSFNCSTPTFQTTSISEKMIRSNKLKPTVVAVERVMKQLGQNTLPVDCNLKTYQNTSFVHNIVEPDRPDRLQVLNHVHRKNVQDVQKIHKLEEINGYLARSYDALLDQVQTLKQEQYTYEDVIDENKFMRKAANLFENLLNVQMHKALNEIDYVHKFEKRCGSNYRKQYGNYFFR